MKPYKGCISNWKIERRYGFVGNPHYPENLGFVVHGRLCGHPRSIGMIRTSLVVSHNSETGYIETLNYQYRLIGPGEF